MSEIDWSKAPEWATHYLPGNGCNPYHSLWLEMDGDLVKSACHIGEREKEFTYSPFNQPSTDVSGRISRVWSGEGRPPVGTVCELLDQYGCWRKARITALAERGVCFIDHEGFETYVNALAKFRPIRTPEQIAAEEREKAVREMIKAINGDERHIPICTDLYCAGYRKTGEGK